MITFEIVRYHFEIINNEPKIVIDMVKVLKYGNYVKFAKLKDVVNYLSKHDVVFKELNA